jgi:hypothetical protein
MKIDTERGTGRTTKQMVNAPHGAVFVSCHPSAVAHDRELAQKHGRADLKIVAPRWLETGWIGHELTGVVVDHAARVRQEWLDRALTRVRK